MNTDHDERDEAYEEDDAPRSIFSAVWFRVVLVVLALGLVGTIAIPYVLDITRVPPTTTALATAPPEGAGARSVTTPAAPAKPVAPTLVPPPKPSTPATPMTAPAPPATDKPAASAESAATAKPARTAETAKPVERPRTAEPAKRADRAKVADSAKGGDQPNAFPAVKQSIARGERVAAVRSGASDAKDGASGEYFVQVGAFKDEGMAKRVVARLRDSNYPVAEFVTRPSGTSTAADSPRTTVRSSSPGDRYDVLVSGGTVADINTKLAAKGLASEPSGDGVRIRPSLPLRDAVALSKDLGSDGFKVQVRRGSGASSEAAAPQASTGSGGATLYRVRVGGYADRAAAQTVLRELRDKGYDPFIAKGRD